MEFSPLHLKHTAESVQLQKIAGELETIRVLLAELIKALKAESK